MQHHKNKNKKLSTLSQAPNTIDHQHLDEVGLEVGCDQHVHTEHFEAAATGPGGLRGEASAIPGVVSERVSAWVRGWVNERVSAWVRGWWMGEREGKCMGQRVVGG